MSVEGEKKIVKQLEEIKVELSELNGQMKEIGNKLDKLINLQKSD